MVKNSIFSILYLLANLGLLVLLAYPIFLSGLFTDLALYIAAGCVLIMLLSTFLLAFQKADRPTKVTKVTLFYNDLVACGALALLYYMMSHSFAYLLILVIPVILFFVSFLFLIDDLVHYHKSPRQKEAAPEKAFLEEDFPEGPAEEASSVDSSSAEPFSEHSLAVDPDIFESVSDVKELPKEDHATTPSNSMFQGVEMRSISFDDFADYVEEEDDDSK